VRIKGDILTHARLLSLLEFPPAAYRRRQESRFHNFILSADSIGAKDLNLPSVHKVYAEILRPSPPNGF